MNSGRMKQWRETQSVLRRLGQLQATGVRAALATVVRVRGSAYRRAGAKLLVAEDGSSLGNVSGGCLEQDVRESALRVISTQHPVLRSYCSGADDIGAWDMGLGCDGQVEVFVEPIVVPMAAALELLDADVPLALCTRVPMTADTEWRSHRLLVRLAGGRDLHDGSLGSGELDVAVLELAAAAIRQGSSSALHEIAGETVFVDVLLPPARLLVIGAGEDARPFTRLAVETGFRVAVVDRRPALLARERFVEAVQTIECDATSLVAAAAPDERCCAVLMTHNYADDRDYLEALLGTKVRYIGLLGPRQRTARLLESLDVHRPADLERIHAPVGLDIGGEGAEQVALAMVGEILATLSGRRALPLRERTAPIHARAV